MLKVQPKVDLRLSALRIFLQPTFLIRHPIGPILTKTWSLRGGIKKYFFTLGQKGGGSQFFY